VGGLLPTVFAGNVERAIRSIREGRSASQVFEAEQLATPIAARMLAVGERSGELAQMLEQAAAFHEEESARWVDWFTRLFEPVLMTAIGLIIGVIVVLMYMPIFELAGAID
jgi:general secretion pathway protein F